MTDRDNYQRVGVEVDEQSFARLTQKANDTANSMGRLVQVNQSIADSAGQAGSRLQQAFANVQANIDSDTRSLQQLRSQLTGAASDAANLNKNSAGGGGAPNDSFTLAGARRSGAFLNRVGLGAIGEPLQFIGSLQSLEKTIDSIGASVKVAVPAFSALDATLVGTAATLTPLIALVGAVAIGIKLYNDKLADSAKSLDTARVALDTYYKTIETGTTESTQKQLDTLKAQKANIDAEVANIQTALNKGFESAKQQFGGDLGARIVTAGISATNEEFRKLGDRLNELKKQSSDLDGQMVGLGIALDSAAIKVNDLAEATLKEADKTASTQLEQYKLIRTGTSKQIQGIIDDNKDRLQVNNQELATLNAIKDPTADVTKRIDELNKEFNTLSSQSAALTPNVLSLVKAREAEAEALKTLNEQVQQAQKLRDERAQKEVDIVKKLDDQINSIEDSAAQSRLQIAQKLQDALIKAAQAAVDAADKALVQLTQKRDENLLALNRDLDKADREAAVTQLNDQIAEQRKERDTLQAHLETLQQIRDRDKSRERDDLLNRNYRDLFSLKEQQNTDIQTENRQYVQKQQQSRQALADQLDDERRAQGQQRKERLIAYQQANQDAVRQYNIELQQAEDTKQKTIALARQANRTELADLNNATNQKIRIAQAGAKTEIQLVSQTEQQKFKIFEDYLNRARQLAGESTYTPAFNSPTAISAATPNAEGGINPAYRPIKVNDRYGGQRESANGVLLPRGLGLFIPMTNTSINPGAGGGNTSQVYNNTFNIQSHDPVGVRNEVIKVLNQAGGKRR